jgi:hypothetical protein
MEALVTFFFLSACYRVTLHAYNKHAPMALIELVTMTMTMTMTQALVILFFLPSYTHGVPIQVPSINVIPF